MKRITKKMVLVLVILTLTIFVSALLAEAKLVPRITNFIIVIDQSGSMFMKHNVYGKTKATLAKGILLQINERIPELGYKGAIQVFSPDRTLIGPEEYNQEFFADAIGGLIEDGKIYGNLTPLGKAIRYTEKNIPLFYGKTVIILVSDGIANVAGDPLKAAKAVYSDYPNVCFHVISFADSEKGRKTLKEISDVSNCIYVEASDLLSDAVALDHFVNQVFYMEVPDEAPLQVVAPPAPAAVQEVTLEELEFEPVHFDFNRYDLKPDWLPFLDRGAELLLKRSDVTVVIQGHTDWTGPEEYNQRLSELRAKAVYDYFLAKGIAADRMKTIGYGETMPEVSNLTPEGRAVNRRAQIEVVD